MTADLVLLNGKIVTVDPDETLAEAVAVKFNKILMVGSNEEVKSLIGKKTQVINLKGRTVVPGLIDTHGHLASSGLSHVRGVIDSSLESGVKSIADIQEMIAERVTTIPKGEWITGRNFDETKLAEKRMPTRWDLDKVAPDHPVNLSMVGGHVYVVNSKAFELAGITKETTDPPGGAFGRDPETGELNGVVYERAVSLLRRTGRPVRTQMTTQMLMEGIKWMTNQFVAAGLTGFHDSHVGPQQMKAYQKVLASGDLPLRVRLDISSNLLPDILKIGLFPGFGNDWLKIMSIKIVTDGAVSGRTAAVKEPYLHRPNFYGILTMTKDELRKIVLPAHKAGFRVSVHANGDRAIEQYLDVIEEALKEHPRKDHRHRDIHCSVIDPTLLERIKKLGVIPTIFGAYPYYHGDKIIQAFGNERLQWMFAAKSFLDAGIKVAAHSDYSASPYSPLMGIHSLVNRRTAKGKIIGKNQKISVMEAIKMYTINAAYHSFEEEVLGSIEENKLADMVVLSEDILTVSTERIIDILVDMTIVGGKIVYQRGV